LYLDRGIGGAARCVGLDLNVHTYIHINTNNHIHICNIYKISTWIEELEVLRVVSDYAEMYIYIDLYEYIQSHIYTYIYICTENLYLDRGIGGAARCI